MPPTDEQPQGNPDEQVQELGGVPLPEGLPTEETPSGDPLDAIEDPVGRAEAKKWRAIAQRHEKKPKEEVAVAAPTAAFTKRDWYLANSKKAIEQLKADPDMAQFADDIQKTYVNRRGQEDDKSIFEDLKDAFAVVKFRSTPVTGNPAAELQTTVAKAPSAKPPVSAERKTERVIRKTGDITGWYSN